MIALKEGPGSLSQRLYGALSRAILEGRFAGGDPIPSSRALAAQLGISRNTVNSVMARLEAEGFIVVKPSSGAYAAPGARASKPKRSRPRESDYVGFRAKRNDIVDFKSGLPDGRFFPVARWASAVSAALKESPPSAFGYGEPEGRPELREAIAAYLNRYRAAECSPENVLVTAGTTQAIGIIGSILVAAGKPDAIVEDPLTSDIKAILARAGARVLPVPVGEDGLDVRNFPARARPALVYATPSHQYPTGASMPIRNRLELIEYARASGAFAVEDDYDSEFRFDGPPLPSLQGLAPEAVIYVGTFSKTLCPALRCGYLILPKRLIKAARQAKWLSDLHNPVLDQLALARFIREGGYASHVNRMKRVYRARRERLVEALSREAEMRGLEHSILGSPAGLHLVARFPGLRFGPRELASIEAGGSKAYPVAPHSLARGAWEDGLILGYGSLDEEEIDAGTRLLAESLATLTSRRMRPGSRPAGKRAPG